MDLYSARIHQLSGAQGALLPLLIRLIYIIPETISAPWGVYSSIAAITAHIGPGLINQLCPHRYPFKPLGGEKQLRLSVLLKDTSVTAGIRNHILLLTPELESGKLDRSATTLQILTYLLTPNTYLLTDFPELQWHSTGFCPALLS